MDVIMISSSTTLRIVKGNSESHREDGEEKPRAKQPQRPSEVVAIKTDYSLSFTNSLVLYIIPDSSPSLRT